jgi:hypothetical protein
VIDLPLVDVGDDFQLGRPRDEFIESEMVVEGPHDATSELLLKEDLAFEFFGTVHFIPGSRIEDAPIIFIVAGLFRVLNKCLHNNYISLQTNQSAKMPLACYLLFFPAIYSSFPAIYFFLSILKSIFKGAIDVSRVLQGQRPEDSIQLQGKDNKQEVYNQRPGLFRSLPQNIRKLCSRSTINACSLLPWPPKRCYHCQM